MLYTTMCVSKKEESTTQQNVQHQFGKVLHPKADIAIELGLQYINMPHRSPDAGVFNMRDLRQWLKPYFSQRSFFNY